MHDVDDAYKRLQVESVSNLSGSNPFRISLLISAVTSTLLVKKYVPLNEPFLFALILQLVLLYPHAAWLFLAFTLFDISFSRKSIRKANAASDFAKVERKAFITNFKAITALLTLFCILAVDFRAFPRELAKTETYGLSLMDLGVGAVVFSMGLTSGRFWQQPDYLGKVCKSSLMTLCIGLGRLVVVKLSGYHEHESEYGRHWNFFLTLALIPVLVAFVKKFVKASRFLLIALGLELVKSYLNHRYHTEAFIMGTTERVGLIQQNREGLYSTLGYLSIYLTSAYLGKSIYRYKIPAQWRRFAYSLLVVCMVSTVLGAASWNGYEPSRRCANTPYVLWTVAICGWQLLFLFWYEWHYGYKALASTFLESISKHQLSLFLIANVLTGLINMTFRTLLMNRIQTHLVLSGYLLAQSLILKLFQ